MIDTIAIRHRIPLFKAKQMSEMGFTVKLRHSAIEGQRFVWKLYQPSEQTFPRLTWSSSPSGDWLTAEVSLPKMLYGNNLISISEADIAAGFEHISRFISEVAGVDFDSKTALVGRVDFCNNFAVGEANVLPYLLAASHGTVSRMTKHLIENTTVCFSNKSRRITLYSKHHEVFSQFRKGAATVDELRDSTGVLRLEVSYRNSDGSRKLAKKYGLSERHAHLLLTSGIAYSELKSGLEMLGLDRITDTLDARIDVLRAHFGDTSHCRRLVAFLGFLDRYGENFWRPGFGGYARSTYFQYARDLKAAGVWLKAERQLLPLNLVRPDSVARAA